MDSSGGLARGGTGDQTTSNDSQFRSDEHTKSPQAQARRPCTSTFTGETLGVGRGDGSHVEVEAEMGSGTYSKCQQSRCSSSFTTSDTISARQKKLSKRDKKYNSGTKGESTAKEQRELEDEQQAMAGKGEFKPFDQAKQEGLLSLRDLYQSEDVTARESIGGETDLRVYAEKEWKGCTEKTIQMRQAYRKLVNLGYQGMRSVRGDNYCALRATLYQALQCKIPLLNSLDASITKIPQYLKQVGCHWIDHWHFPQRNQNTNALAELQICLVNLLAELQKWQVHDKDDCRAFLSDLGKNEWRLYEAMKLLMLNTAVNLYGRQQRAEDIPLFACLLFARETSSCPRDFFFNHLMHVGSSGGLEQVEMCLLGHTLGLVLHVFRLYKLNSEEFEVFYPEHNGTLQSEVVLLTEDDRHYNVLLKTVDSPI
uniref:ubiquitin thioesterase otulin-like isoform X2 n=1 Tax=Myxine glutinosa TaxID=7769 RepID=UPI00358F5DE0